MLKILKPIALAFAALSGLTVVMIAAAALIIAVPIISMLQGISASQELRHMPGASRAPVTIEGEYRVVT